MCAFSALACFGAGLWTGTGTRYYVNIYSGHARSTIRVLWLSVNVCVNGTIVSDTLKSSVRDDGWRLVVSQEWLSGRTPYMLYHTALTNIDDIRTLVVAHKVSQMAQVALCEHFLRQLQLDGDSGRASMFVRLLTELAYESDGRILELDHIRAIIERMQSEEW